MSSPATAAAGTSSSAAAGPAPASQTIPPINSNAEVADLSNAESAFPKPAIYTISVIGGLVVLIVLYKAYKWAWGRHARRQGVRTSYPAGQVENGNMREMGGGATIANPAKNYGRLSSYNSLGEEFGAKNASQPSFVFPSISSSAGGGTRSSALCTEAASSGLPTPSPTSASLFIPRGPSPPVPAHAHSFVRGDSSMSTDVLRAKGSRASLVAAAAAAGSGTAAAGRRDRRSTLPHSYSAHSSEGSHPSSSTDHLPAPPMPTSNRYSTTLHPTPRRPRVSGPPHARHSRIEIVTPAPLAPPPGSIVAVDKATLAFSSLSGITGAAQGESVMGLSELVNTAAENAAAASEQRPGTGSAESSASPSARPMATPASSSRAAKRTHQHARVQSAATAQTHLSDESYLSSSSASSPSPFPFASTGSSPAEEGVPPLPEQYASAQKGERGAAPGPQSPLDKLKLQLEGEARRVGGNQF